MLEDVVRAGAFVQLTAASVDGRLGRAAASCARRLLELELAHCIASDAHGPGVREAGLSGAVARRRWGRARALAHLGGAGGAARGGGAAAAAGGREAARGVPVGAPLTGFVGVGAAWGGRDPGDRLKPVAGRGGVRLQPDAGVPAAARA